MVKSAGVDKRYERRDQKFQSRNTESVKEDSRGSVKQWNPQFFVQKDIIDEEGNLID